MIPRVFGLLTVQGNLWIYNALASTLAAGSIAVFNLARNFQSLPVSLFAIALATVIFPKLAEHFANTASTKLIELANRAIRQLIFFTVPAAVGMMVLARPLVATLLGSGRFDVSAVTLTGFVLAVFAISIPLESLQHVLARVFYAQHDTKTPVKIAVVGLMINALVCLLAIRYFGVTGLALGFIGTSLSQVVLLNWALRRRGQKIIRLDTLRYSSKIAGLSLVMGGLMWLSLRITGSAWQQCVIGSVIGLLWYGGLSYWLRLPEFHATVIMLKTLWQNIAHILNTRSASV